MTGGASFDRTRQYRYNLWREWDEALPMITFIMLNPSRADRRSNDPTIRRCIGLAQSWGYGRLEVVNLFAYRTPNPQNLLRAIDPIGRQNDRHLRDAFRRSQTIVAAWGNHGRLFHRDQAIAKLFQDRCNLFCIRRTRSGQPCHPLYVRKDAKLESFALNEFLEPRDSHSVFQCHER